MVLFSALSIGTLVYRGATGSLQKTREQVRLCEALPAAMAQVEQGLYQEALHGTGNYGAAVEYSWTAEKVESARNVLGYSDLGTLEYGNFRVTLYGITLRIRLRDRGPGREERYQYHALAWARQIFQGAG